MRDEEKGDKGAGSESTAGWGVSNGKRKRGSGEKDQSLASCVHLSIFSSSFALHPVTFSTCFNPSETFSSF